jgi:hypothetical protein
LALVFSFWLLGCGKPTLEDAVAACHAFERSACTRYTACLSAGPLAPDGGADPAAAVEDCIAENVRSHGTCEATIRDDSCVSAKAESFAACAGDVDRASCSSLCSGGSFTFCFHPCVYVCPAGSRDPKGGLTR